jgi:MFS transporter, DHA2 family, multidrug resistance protein
MIAARLRSGLGAAESQWSDGYPIAPSRRFLAGMALCVSNFMVILDTTVANVSVPHIAGNLGATLDQGTWVITSYAVAEAITVPLSGWLSQRFGEVRVFLTTLIGFSIFSLLCGISVTLPMLVICRLGQGLCGGPLMPLVQTLITRVFPPAQLPKAFAIWAMTVMIGPAFGPVVGGLISDQLSWHWIFLINVPIGAVCAVVGFSSLRPAETPTLRVPVDKIGMVLLVVWVGALQLMLDTGRDRDWFADPMIIALTIIAVVGLCAFIIWELTEEHPAVNIRLLKNRPFAMLLGVLSLSYAAFFAGGVMLPQWLQVTMGYTATQAGMLMALSPFASLITAQLTLRYLLKVSDARIFVWAGCIWAAISFYLRGGWSTDADPFAIGWVVMFQGVGLPVLMMTLNNMSLSTIPDEDMAGGAGLNAFIRTMSIAIGSALMLTMWGNEQTVARSGLSGVLNTSDTVTTLAQHGMPGTAAYSYISAVVDRQANTVAMLNINMIAAVAVFLAGSTIWLLPRIELTRLKGKGRAPSH